MVQKTKQYWVKGFIVNMEKQKMDSIYHRVSLQFITCLTKKKMYSTFLEMCVSALVLGVTSLEPLMMV